MSRKSIVVGTVVGRKNLQLYLQLSVAYTAVLKPAISGTGSVFVAGAMSLAQRSAHAACASVFDTRTAAVLVG